MTLAENQYFALLRAALWGTPVAIDGNIDWPTVMELAQHHANNVLVCGVATQMTGSNAPSAELRAQMQFALRSNLMKQLQLKQIYLSAVQLLRQHDIEPVLLKGFGLAMLYPKPNQRQFGDIDLFVGLDKFHEACSLLRTLPGGYNWGEEVDFGHHYNIEFGQIPMEVHRVSADVDNPEEAAIFSAIELEGMTHSQRVSFEGTEISIPSKEFVVFYTFYHAWHHFITSGVGWRQISDVAMTLHAYFGQLDLEKLHQWLTALHLMQPWQTFGFLMVEHLGLPQAEMPFYDASCHRRAQRLYRRIMEVGNFRRKSEFRHRKPKKAGIRRKLHSIFGIFVDFFYLAKVFPIIAFHDAFAKWKLVMKKNFKKK
jgi:hypothetical protein